MLLAYDLAKNLPCYDIICALMGAEQERLRREYGYIDVEIIPGPNEGFGAKNIWPHGRKEKRKMMRNVVIPMCRMLPSVRKVTYLAYEEDASPNVWRPTHTFSQFVQAYKLGIRPMRCPPDEPRRPRLVTITLREAEHWSTRNSDLGEWIAAANELKKRKWNVVFVRDTRLGRSKIIGHEVNVSAAFDLGVRAQLYRSAFCNMVVNNGPGWFAMALDAPTLMLKPATETAGKAAKAESLRQYGIDDNGMPGAPPHQRLVWREDTTDAILDEFYRFADTRGKEAA